MKEGIIIEKKGKWKSKEPFLVWRFKHLNSGSMNGKINNTNDILSLKLSTEEPWLVSFWVRYVIPKEKLGGELNKK